MDRMVFRPKTQLRRTICTTESLRTSTRVSPGFVLARPRSPSFGYQRVRSGSASSRNEIETPRECEAGPIKGLGTHPPSKSDVSFTFISHLGFDTQWLAHTLNSLVRVSRRVGQEPETDSPLTGAILLNLRKNPRGYTGARAARRAEARLDTQLATLPKGLRALIKGSLLSRSGSTPSFDTDRSHPWSGERGSARGCEQLAQATALTLGP